MALYSKPVDSDELISNVQATTCLWDHRDPNYYKRDYQRVGWIEVADAMKAPVNELKKRWRGLRDTFSRELRRLDMSEFSGSTVPLVQRSSWRHFPRLLFLLDVVSTSRKPLPTPPKRPRQSRAAPPEDEAALAADTLVKQEYCDADEDANMTDMSEQSEAEGELPMPAVEPAQFKLEQPDTVATGSLPHAAVQEGPMDADAQFLLSLLPFLQDVPKKRKLLVRARLSQVLMDEQVGLEQDNNHH